MKNNFLSPFYKLGRQTIAQSVSFQYNRWLLRNYLQFGKESTRFIASRALSKTVYNTISRTYPSHIEKTNKTLLCSACFHNNCDSDSEDSDSEVLPDVVDLYAEPEVVHINSFHHLLQKESDDLVIQKLNACVTVQEIFDVIKEHKYSMTACQTSQAVLLLWNLQKYFCRANIQLAESSISDTNYLGSSGYNPGYFLNTYIHQISNHDEFVSLLRLVDSWHTDFCADVSTCLLLYLNKMGVNIKHPTMQKLVLHCEDLVNKLGENFPLTALSRLTVAVHSTRGIWPILVWQHLLPHIISNIDKCDKAEDFKLLTICLNHVHQIIGMSTLEAYKKKAEELVKMQLLTGSDSKAIVKAINFLNYPHWSHCNAATIRMLILQLKGHISSLDPKDVVYVHKVFQSQLEPTVILDEIQDYAKKLLDQDENYDNSPMMLSMTIELLSCLVTNSSPLQKNMLEEHMKCHISSTEGPASLPAIFGVLRHLKTSDIELCNMFWSQTLQNIQTNSFSDREDYRLLRHCYRYMHFNNNLGGTFRHFPFENQMKEWLMQELDSGIMGFIPSRFARIASFMIAYSGKSDSLESLDDLVAKLLEMVPQFNPIDCLNISRGLQISMLLRNTRNRSLSPSYLSSVVKVNTAMNDFTIRWLQNKDATLLEVTMLLRAYINRKGSVDTELMKLLMERYKTQDQALSSRLLRDIVFNLHATSYLLPEMIEALNDYVIQNSPHLLGDTACKLLYHCYTLGYTPTWAETFLPIVGDLILRDRERMNGLALLQGSLALCYFQKFPSALIRELFTVDFLERLDEEISRCYSKATYPMRMRHNMMQLNRAVCLDYPEADIPWFHEKYCQEITSLEGTRESPFFSDVLMSLVKVVGSKELIATNVYSPYFYKIDIQILLNEKKNPVRPRHQSDTGITRIAILLYKDDDYCSNVSQLKGAQSLKRRHLEILGFRVVGISSSLWHSMFMTEPMAKDNYLHDMIWPTAVSS